MMHRRRAYFAFTLVEALVVIVIMAVLLAVLYPIFAASREKARASACEAKLRAIATALQEFRQDHGQYPNSLDALKDGYLTSGAAYCCPSDARAGRNTYDLFYARRGVKESKDRITLACALHGRCSGMIMHLDGTVDNVQFQTATLEGVALVLRREAGAFAAHNGRPLNPGDVVQTGASAVTLTFQDGSTCEVTPDTRLSVCTLAADSDGHGSYTLLYMYWGEIVCEVQNLLGTGSTFEVATPSVVAGVRGTCFGVRVDRQTREALVSVYSGDVSVTTPSGRGGGLKAGQAKKFRAPKDAKEKEVKEK